MNVFPGIIFVLIGMNMLIVAVTVVLSGSDRSFAVLPGYSEAALHWNDIAEAKRRSDALGWTAHAALEPVTLPDGSRPLVIHLSMADGTPVHDATVTAVVFAASMPRQRVEVVLPQTQPGRYQNTLILPARGRWHVGLAAQRGPEAFHAELIVEDTESPR
jgi:nitrogen fixation protein FixH